MLWFKILSVLIPSELPLEFMCQNESRKVYPEQAFLMLKKKIIMKALKHFSLQKIKLNAC